MTVAALFFYLYSAILLAAGFMVISARNPVHSVLYLILAFFNAAALFVLLGAEFVAMILIIVYVGAVAVLFLFVVMMLDIDITELREGMLQYLPVGATIGVILLIELIVVFGGWAISPDAGSVLAAPMPAGGGVSNTEALGLILYTKYVYLFQAAGIVLLIAMIGAIVLTLHHRPQVKRQSISEQVARPPETSVENHNIKPGQGI